MEWGQVSRFGAKHETRGKSQQLTKSLTEDRKQKLEGRLVGMVG